MARSKTERLVARVRQGADWSAAALLVKGAVCCALPAVATAFSGSVCYAGACGFAVLAALAFAVGRSVRDAPSWAFGFAVAASLDVILTGAVIGLPAVHPVLTVTLLAAVYGGGALHAAAAWSAANLLRSAPAVALRRRKVRRRKVRRPRSRRAA